MAGYFAVSDAGAIALHAAIMIAKEDGRTVRIRDIAERFSFSGAHLAKVLARLTRAGILTATRGPSGGYRLARPAGQVTLDDIHRAIEGEVSANRCMFRIAACDGTGCPLGGFFAGVSREIEGKLRRTTLADFAETSMLGSEERE